MCFMQPHSQYYAVWGWRGCQILFNTLASAFSFPFDTVPATPDPIGRLVLWVTHLVASSLTN